MKKTAFFILLSGLFANVVLGQSYETALEFGAGAGQMIRNYPDFPEIKEQAIVGSIRYSKWLNGQRPWHRYYNFPVLSGYATGGSLGNHRDLGYFGGAMAELGFEKYTPSKKWFRSLRLALGSAYFTAPYDESDNNTNVVIGSSITFLAAAEVMAGYRINERTALTAKISILHASNSHFQLPNVGMNMPVFSAGVRFKLQEQKAGETDTTHLTVNKRVQFNVRMALGVNEQGSSTAPVNGPKYPIYLSSVYLSKMVSPVNKVTGGIEVWYNKGVYDYIVSQDFYEKNRKQKSYAAALMLGHEFLFGHWGLITNGGIYLYNPFYREKLNRSEKSSTKDKLKTLIPARIGANWYLKNGTESPASNFFVGLYIKTNMGQADFLESGLGYQF
jgi:hypothetical protein